MKRSWLLLMVAGALEGFCSAQAGDTTLLTVKDHRGAVLWPSASYFCQAGTTVVFKVESRLESHPMRQLDTNLLARLKINPDEVEKQLAKAEQKRIESMKSYAAYVQACQAAQARKTAQQLQELQARAETRKTAQEEARKNLEVQTQYNLSQASQLSAQAQVFEALTPDVPEVVTIQNWGYGPAYYWPYTPLPNSFTLPARTSPRPRSQGIGGVTSRQLQPGIPISVRPNSVVN